MILIIVSRINTLILCVSLLKCDAQTPKLWCSFSHLKIRTSWSVIRCGNLEKKKNRIERAFWSFFVSRLCVLQRYLLVHVCLVQIHWKIKARCLNSFLFFWKTWASKLMERLIYWGWLIKGLLQYSYRRYPTFFYHFWTQEYVWFFSFLRRSTLLLRI